MDRQILGGKKEGMKQEHGDVPHMRDMIIFRKGRGKCQDEVQLFHQCRCQMDERMEKRQMQEKKIGLRDG